MVYRADNRKIVCGQARRTVPSTLQFASSKVDRIGQCSILKRWLIELKEVAYIYLDTLKQISKKLSTLINAVNDIKSSIHEWKYQTPTQNVNTVPNDNGGQIVETLELI